MPRRDRNPEDGPGPRRQAPPGPGNADPADGPAVAAIAPGNPGGALSFENIPLLNANIVIMLYASDDLKCQVEGLELFRNLPGRAGGALHRP
jgi:hypothetical protein